MSNYFQVLKRIEKDRTGPPGPVIGGAGAAPEHAPVPAADEPAPTRPLRALSTAPPPLPASAPAASPPPVTPLHPSSPLTARRSARPEPSPVHVPVTPPTPAPRTPRPPAAPLREDAQRGIATLFDNIRALATGRSTRTLVFSGAAPSDSVHAVTDGLARHAERHAMRVLVAELTHTAAGATLIPRRAADVDHEVLVIDLNAAAAPGELNAWIERVGVASDLVLLEAPPLADSIDAALLACACDGLVIVADAEVTPRSALQTAAERAQIAGCRTLGVVMSGTKERIPSWMRRIMGSDDRGGAS